MADVVVIGGGVVGTCTARALARRGREVILLERFRIPHKHGSSHGASRIFRFSYRDARFVRMAQEALPLWRELEQESGERLLTVTGGLDLGVGVEDHAAALEACGVPVEWLDSEEVARRFPSVSIPQGTPALFQPDAGYLSADRAVKAAADSARSHGVDVREEARVLSVRPSSGGVDIETEAETLHAPVAVVAAGGWAKGLLAGAGIDLPVRVTEETVAYFALDEGALIPAVVNWGSPAVYALRSPGQGLKVGEHIAGPVVDPDRRAGPRQESVDRLAAWIRQRYPTADPTPHLAETCLYTNTPDEEFVLDRRGPIVIGSPCSGHGFKFAPLNGERLAALASDRQAA